jgi:hypothetical protein
MCAVRTDKSYGHFNGPFDGEWLPGRVSFVFQLTNHKDRGGKGIKFVMAGIEAFYLNALKIEKVLIGLKAMRSN